jgi:hypothetical protein
LGCNWTESLRANMINLLGCETAKGRGASDGLT